MKSQLSFGISMLAVALVSTSTPVNPAQAQDRTSTASSRALPVQERQVQTTNLRPATLSVAAAFQPSRARPERPRLMPIDWGQVREDLRRQNAQFSDNFTTAARLPQTFPRPSNNEAAQVAQTRLPVLLPNSAALRLANTPRVFLFPQENFYTASINAPGILIEVFGTRLAHTEAPDPATLRRLRAQGPDGYQITQTEYGVEVNFSRYGAAYSITIECEFPLADDRCSELGYGRQLAETIGIVAGSPEEGE